MGSIITKTGIVLDHVSWDYNKGRIILRATNPKDQTIQLSVPNLVKGIWINEGECDVSASDRGFSWKLLYMKKGDFSLEIQI